METFIKSLKFIPKLWAALSFVLMTVVAVTLFWGRSLYSLRVSIIVSFIPDFYEHISNFSLSLLILTAAGYIGLLFGMLIRQIVLIGIVLLLLNLLVEFYFTIGNTPDPIDAIFGTWGVIIGLLFLIIVKKYGLRNNDL